MCFAKVFHGFFSQSFSCFAQPASTAADVQRRERRNLYSCFVPQRLQHINEANAMTPPKNTRDLVEANTQRRTLSSTFVHSSCCWLCIGRQIWDVMQRAVAAVALMSTARPVVVLLPLTVTVAEADAKASSNSGVVEFHQYNLCVRRVRLRIKRVG